MNKIFLTIVLIVSLSFAVFSAKAMTSSEIQKINQIQNYISQIQTLIDQLCGNGACSGSTNSTCTPNWQTGTWSTCSNGTQTRTVTDSNSCGTVTNRPITSQSCTVTPVCNPNWQTGTWSACSNGTQTRTVTDSNNCGTMVNRPVISQSCTVTTICTPNWQTGAWNTCSGGTQTRTVTDLNNCQTTTNRPANSQSCTTTVKTMKLLSPNGSERWEIGNTHYITWRSTGITNVNIFLVSSTATNPNQMYTIATNVPASNGLYTWRIPTDNSLSNSLGVVYYKVKIVDSTVDATATTGYSGDDFDYSDNWFSIIKKTLTISGPNGGEVWRRGGGYFISWQASGILPTNLIIKLRNFATNADIQVPCSGSVNYGYCYFIVNSSVPLSNTYKAIVGDGIINDSSDNFFTIASPITLEEMQGQTASIADAISALAKQMGIELK